MTSRSLPPVSTPSPQAATVIYQAIETGLSELGSERSNRELTMHRTDDSSAEDSMVSARIEDRSLAEVPFRLIVRKAGTTAYEVYIDIEDGPSRWFTYSSSNGIAPPDDMVSGDGAPKAPEIVEKGQQMASFLFDEMTRRTEEALLQENFSMETPSYVPLLDLDQEGTIQDFTEAARRVLEYDPDASIEPCFFSHVHGQNLRRVMRDLAHMVAHGKQSAQWLLRMRTGNGRWRWYRVVVQNYLYFLEGSIQVFLRPV